MIRKLRHFGKNDDPVPETVRCNHQVQILGRRERSWRKNRYGEDGWDLCTFPSVAEVNGSPLCRRHAGQVILDLYISGKLAQPTHEAGLVENDAAVQIAEEAFRAGFRSGVEAEGGGNFEHQSDGMRALEEEAWGAFEPSEAIKELTR